MLGGIGDSRGNDMGGGGGVGRGEFFGGNIRSGWRKCVFEGKKGFLGKIATTILLGGGGQKSGRLAPQVPPENFPPKIVEKFRQKNFGKMSTKKLWKNFKKNFLENVKKKNVEKFQKKNLWENVPKKNFVKNVPKNFLKNVQKKILCKHIPKNFV